MKDIEKKIKNLEIETRVFINGEYTTSLDKKMIPKFSSIDNRAIPSIYAGNEKDINKAVDIAFETFKSRVWVDKPLSEKKGILFKLANLVEENLEELALLDTLETGRSIKNYYYDSIPKAIESMRWFTEAIDKIFDKATKPEKGHFATITREPLGVVGIITPWNDPLVVAFWKIVPALLVGNSIVVKPAEQSSYSILKVAQLAIEAGIPKGVLNIVTGYGEEAGKALALNMKVRGIFFTGSTNVGKKILEYSGQSNMKKVGLECGGKSPFIVSKKCKDLKHSAKVLAKNIFYNQGQICSASSRLIIDKDIKKEFLDYLVEESKLYIPKSPLSLDSEVGALVSKEQFERVKQYINDAKESGAIIVNLKDVKNKIDEGFYVSPVIFDNVPKNSPILKDEIFGPVLVVIEFDNIHEAIEIANDTEYGLAASIWTSDIDEAYNVSRLLEAGIVHINSYGDDNNSVPFGGIKQSGIGQDKSTYAFDEYSQVKTIWISFK